MFFPWTCVGDAGAISTRSAVLVILVILVDGVGDDDGGEGGESGVVDGRE